MLALVALAALLAGLPRQAAAEDEYLDDELVGRVQVCYDFGCKTQRRIYLFDSDWHRVVAVLRGARTAAEERRRIARAVGVMEEVVGEMAPTHVDRGGNDYDGDNSKGQMDCIDESTNTTVYLSFFQKQGLLSFHRVGERVYRAPLVLNQHWAAQLVETSTGDSFAVDSWLRDNGQPALVLPVERWSRGNLYAHAAAMDAAAPSAQ